MHEDLKFEVGKTYEARTAGCHDWRPRYTVVARTAKFVTVVGPDADRKRVGVKVSDGDEWALPTGSYSMALMLRASREAVAEHATMKEVSVTTI